MHRNNYYKPGTHINLKKKDEYAGLVKISNFVYRHILPLVAIFFLIDYALRVNGL
jgi:hypothetical protein